MAPGSSTHSGRPSPTSRRTSTRSTRSTSIPCPTATPVRTCSRPSGRRSTRRSAVAGQPADRVAAAISFGALMGARGNSGVITSQIFRGHGRRPRRQGPVQRPRPGARPVRGCADGVRRGRQAGRGHDPDGHPRVGRRRRDRAPSATPDIESVLGATLDAAERSVARTPSLLAILREAGVVDSGGQGLYRLFQGALLHLAGRSPAGAARERTRAVRAARRSRRSSPTPTRGSATRRCSCSSQTVRGRSTWTRSAITSNRSASPCSWPVTPGRSRSTSTTSAPTS